MKTLLSLFFVVALAPAFAKIYTVSNNPAFPGQYSDVQPAITAASAGDTIYVNGSSATYADFTITKRLVMIGAGYNSNNQFNNATRVSNIYLVRDTGLQNANGTVITGFLILTSITPQGTVAVNNITIFRNQVGYILYTYASGTILGNNWLIFNNVIYAIFGGSGGSLSPSATNITIQNNFIYNSVANFSAISVIVDHNIFLGGNTLSSMFYATITNNIFTVSAGNIFNAGVASNIFNNNLSLLTTVGPNAPTNSFLGGPNSGVANLVGVDPGYVNGSFNGYSPSADYHIKVTSAAHNAGSDGTDLGVYGGSFPFPSGGASGSGFETSPLPPIPQVTDVNIQNPTLQPGTPLNVNVKAKVNN